MVDFAQRSILFWDTLRQRGNNWIEHEKAGKPPLLDFDWEMIADARTFEQPPDTWVPSTDWCAVHKVFCPLHYSGGCRDLDVFHDFADSSGWFPLIQGA